jgi:fructose-bisphosphate aldolase class II
MKTLRECILDAEEKKVAIGHFNVSDTEMLCGVIAASRSCNVPVVIGTSEGERDFIGPKQVVALVQSLREEFDHPIFLNADHTYSLERVKEAIQVGYDAVIFDGAKLSFEENVELTRECVKYAKDSGKDVLVEGEIGYIGKSSKLLDEVPKGADITEDAMTKPEELSDFVAKTGVDLVAPAVGNLHGMLKSGKNPNISADRIKEAGGVPMVLHGGSGITDDDFTRAIAAGMSTIHVSTEIRVAYRKAIQISLQENPEEVAPYKYMKNAVQAVQHVVEGRLKLFNNL